MTNPLLVSHNIHKVSYLDIEAILFDMNGTLRRSETHAPTQNAAVTRMLELMGRDGVPDGFWEELARRYTAYGQWAQENLLQLPEKEIWTRWLLPDFPYERIEPVAEQLSLAWKDRKGRSIPQTGAEETLTDLKQRGYRLGVISNSMSSMDIPRSLDGFGWKGFFDVVVLSASAKSRKPAPEMFWEAARKMNVVPEHCAYLGNRISRDVVGCKRAGFALAIIIEPDGKPRQDEQGQPIQPDAIIHSLNDLLDIFPIRVLPQIKV